MLVWLIALALPAQGVAAVTMALCGPIHQRMASAAELVVAAHHHASTDAHDSTHDAHELPGQKYNCSACATCCMSTAISSPLLQPPAIPAGTAVLVSSQYTGVSGFIPDTPEHPPRSILA
jgi:hypothetical protein